MDLGLIKEKVLSGGSVTKAEALYLTTVDINKLGKAADEIRKHFCGNKFDMCAVMSVKGGRCSENCKFCSQSCVSKAEIPSFKIRETDYVKEDALAHSGLGISHYCQVASGRKMNDEGIETICKNTKAIVENTDLTPCVSLGLLTKDDLIKLKKSGVKRVHNNLETGPAYFPKVCTSHTYEEKLQTIRLIRECGLELCSGGIFGIGESWNDRIDMALILREFKPESVPINMLNPVKGTPMGDRPVLSREEVMRIICVYRFILPASFIRLAAGRDYLEDGGKLLFTNGCNATITGDMVTVKGISIKEDLSSIEKIGFDLNCAG